MRNNPIYFPNIRSTRYIQNIRGVNKKFVHQIFFLLTWQHIGFYIVMWYTENLTNVQVWSLTSAHAGFCINNCESSFFAPSKWSMMF